MFKRKYFLIAILFITFSIVTFMISYNLSMKKINNNNIEIKEVNTTENNSSEITLGDVISPDTKITLKTYYKKSGDMDVKEIDASKYLGKNKEELEKLGYNVESINSKEVILVKTIDSYAPNKYILGVKDKCFAIYRTDENANLIIEEETGIEVPTEEDHKLLLKGSKDFQFKTKEEVEEKLGEFIS
ncbi:hypothetical protein SAMN05428976_102166 [Clostridium sp. USBA 49]|jgi:hypothetical protein|uniref:hypothetical protein n=1 Tax=Clostridium TaxID=1485 RepID=UPI000999CBD4|nr:MULTISPECIES: hypothetical protein [Clostridium]SKA75723.1 hypothetical protein SAMN05428976_102166 [Clostridium sp. USBA 49]